jgi:hypothetical protein
MTREVPIHDFGQPHLAHLTDEPRHIIDTLRDDHTFTFSYTLLGLLTQRNSPSVLSSLRQY